MWNFKTCFALINLLWATVQAGHNNILREYTLRPSNEVGSYHYPAPPKSLQLLDPRTARQPEYSDIEIYQRQGGLRPIYGAQRSSVVTKQFSLPALDNEAFSLAWNNRGYKFGITPPFRAELRASSSSTRTTSQTSPSTSPSSSSAPVLGSLNVKLPLPVGVTPLNIAPLPLQTGTPYVAIPNGVTSYGTVYPQRKRR